VKYTKILQVLAVSVALSLLIMVIPAAPALAAEAIDLSPSEGEVGDDIDIDCEDMDTTPAGMKVYFYFSPDEADVGDDIGDEVEVYELVEDRVIDSDGTVGNAHFDVPDELDDGDYDDVVVAGYYYVYAVYEEDVGEDEPDTQIVAVDEFTVRGISLDTDKGTVGTEVEINGLGFSRSRDIAVEYDGTDIDIVDGDEQTDRSGDFDGTTILIPESTAGEHTITVVVRNDQASATFTVEPEMAISPTSGETGSEVTVTGTGFGEEKNITIAFNGVTAATDETDEDGSFTASFSVPDVAAAIYEVEVEDEDDNKGEATFTVLVSTGITISPVTSAASPAHAGMNLAVSGTGFRANAPITITDTTSGTLLTTTTSTADGAFQVTFEAEGSAGQHIIIASDGTDTLQVSFVMESQAPAAPALISPEDAAIAEAQAIFDWADVADDSGVTYTLQLATSSDFTPASLVLEKTGLTASQYTLTEGQALEATKEEAPYYWRVKAIDGVSNEGEWSTLRSFNVGTTFKIAGGILYGIMGAGGLLLLGLGFWLGRRTAYSSF